MEVTTRRSKYVSVRTRPAEPPRGTSILGKGFVGIKTDVQTKANSVPSDAVASIIRPLTSSGGDTWAILESLSRQERERDVDLISTLRKLTARRYDCYLKNCWPRFLRPACTLLTSISKKLLRDVRCCANSYREDAQSNCKAAPITIGASEFHPS